MSTNFVAKGTEIIKEAVIKDNNVCCGEEYPEALKLYSSGVEYLMTGLKYEKNPRIHATIKEKVGKYLERAEEIQKMLNDEKKPKKKKVKAHAGGGTKGEGGADGDDKEEEDEDTAKMKGYKSIFFFFFLKKEGNTLERCSFGFGNWFFFFFYKTKQKKKSFEIIFNQTFI
ncbi:vacuolar protein sorting-associated protein VPS4 [Reticulomyxa filosa]|uniref:Vacuolar protein sorting-associated protein VPS4 n=1 Tax=Reticulomyxa filosa TaxID=46433 RepID=X6MCT5_RETFI|nr:vacuolar protein sorting-associated protein VPS4 [Reticulomyxa filosa]|eukprot:ETO11262.1 vacuolar protein sorting-associated protein VPS4 [Reticulomyxa filosa]